MRNLIYSFLLTVLLFGQWVQGNSSEPWTGGGGWSTVTLGVTAGDLIVVCANSGTTSTVAPVISAAVALTTTTLPITATATGGVNDIPIQASNFHNAGGTIPRTANAVGSDPNAATVNLTTSASNTLLVACADGLTSLGKGTGFPTIQNYTGAIRWLSEYQTSMSNPAGTLTASVAAGTGRGNTLAAFNPPGATAPPTKVRCKAVTQ